MEGEKNKVFFVKWNYVKQTVKSDVKVFTV